RFAGESGECYPSMARLGRELGACRRQAQRYVRELISARLIRTQSRKAKDGDADSNVFEFLWHSIFDSGGVVTDVSGGGDRCVTTVVTDLSGGVVTDMSHKESHCKRVIEESNTSPSKGDGEASPPNRESLTDKQTVWFDSFWRMFWRKIGKKPAEAAFRKAVRSEERWEAVR
ncbi:MAG: helix-turn-helix domain-containing protein, partial [Bryobacteraceae bacterium]|nr:helix-turn-helix domain-containing protein [Bryobacteraceae bacterium]